MTTKARSVITKDVSTPNRSSYSNYHMHYPAKSHWLHPKQTAVGDEHNHDSTTNFTAAKANTFPPANDGNVGSGKPSSGQSLIKSQRYRSPYSTTKQSKRPESAGQKCNKSKYQVKIVCVLSLHLPSALV